MIPRDPAIPRRRSAGILAVAVVVALVAVAGCGSSVPSGSPAAVAPSGGSATSAGSDAATPRPTPWPGSTADGIIALGAGASQMGLALQDLQKAVDNSDPRAMLGAAEGFNTLLKKLEPNIDLIKDYPTTKPIADTTRQSFDVLIPATQALADDLRAGRSDRIADDVTKIGQGMAIWTEQADQLSGLVAQALEQKRLLTK